MEKLKTIQTRVTPQLYHKLLLKALKTNQKISTIIRDLLEKYVSDIRDEEVKNFVSS
jgi:predicted DNA-binding protein